MKEHKRSLMVRKAEREASSCMLDLQQKYRLTFAEQFSILSALLAETAKYALRAERHPDDPSRPADVE